MFFSILSVPSKMFKVTSHLDYDNHFHLNKKKTTKLCIFPGNNIMLGTRAAEQWVTYLMYELVCIQAAKKPRRSIRKHSVLIEHKWTVCHVKCADLSVSVGTHLLGLKRAPKYVLSTKRWTLTTGLFLVDKELRWALLHIRSHIVHLNPNSFCHKLIPMQSHCDLNPFISSSIPSDHNPV